MKYKHYAPTSPLCILSGSDEDIMDFINAAASDKRIGFLCYTEMIERFEGLDNIIAIPIGAKDNLPEQARNLFSALNAFNAFNNSEVSIIYSIEPKKTGIGEALYDRLIKAAGGEIIKA